MKVLSGHSISTLSGIVLIGMIACAAAMAQTPLELTSLGTPSQTTDHGSGLYPASNAVDGDVTTFNHTDSVATGSAWELHFPSELEMGSIEVVMRDSNGGRLNGGTLRLFDAEAEMIFEHFVVDPGAGEMFSVLFPEGTLARDIRIGFDAGQSGIVHLAEVRVYAAPGSLPVIDSYTVAPDSIDSGQSATLSWETSDAVEVEIYGIGPVAVDGSASVSPQANSAYILTATNEWGSTTQSCSVQVDGIPLLPLITEFSAFPDDWVEIWNPDNSPLELTGWYLSDETADPFDWAIPPGLVIPPGEFLVIDEPFGIAREAGSYLALVDPSGSVVSSYSYPRQYENGTYGTTLEGNETFFLEPSPGTFNGGATTLGILRGATFSARRGFYDSPFLLTLAPMTSGATVLYSTDGSDPVTPYTTPIPISTTTVIRAIETLPGHVPSRSRAQTYLFVGHIVSQPQYPAACPTDWQPPSASGVFNPIPRPSDYEMDPAVVAAGPFTDGTGARFDVAGALLDIPSLCLTLPIDELLDPTDGLHANGSKRGRDWERDISMEILDPVAAEHFHTGCGLRIHGGRGRYTPEMLKKSFRLYFRGDYGATKLDYPVFDGRPSGGLDHLVLRGGNGKTWATPWTDWSAGPGSLTRITYLRDQFLRDTQRDLGQPAFAGNFVHLYFNGIYWGLYNSCERPGGPYAANHFGGDDDTDWDFLKWANGLPRQIVAGTVDAWDEVMDLARADGTGNYPAIEQRVDIDNLADYLIANAWVGNRDWAATGNNGYAFRSRTDAWDRKFRFMCWDGEESLLGLTDNSTEGGRNDDTPMDLHKKIRGGTEYKLRYADRVHKHIVDEDGVLRTTPATSRHEFLVTQIDRAICAESARWGDLIFPATSATPYTYTREADWLPENANLNDNYFTGRPATTLAHLQADGLYPATAAPVASLVNGDQLEFSAPAGTIWFTTDGSDPRLPGGAVSPTAQAYGVLPETTLVAYSSDWHYLDNGTGLAGPSWKQVGYNDSGWLEGPAPLGYGDVGSATLNTTVSFGPDDQNKHITSYFRRSFQVADASSLGQVLLRYFRDDGIAIYLNGTEIVRSNLPAGAIDSETLAPTSIGGSDESAIHVSSIPVSLLVDGENTLAVELHQRAGHSSDLGFDLELVDPLGGLPLGGDAHIKARALNGADWSALEEETYRFTIPADALVISEIMYHPSDPNPAELAAGFDDDDFFEFIELRNISDRNIVLDGLRFTKGVDVALAGTLAPGATALVVHNLAAFLMRYGSDLPVIAQWEGGDKLDNGGELIRIRDAANNIVLEFEYDDVTPWPDDPDGGGTSLVLVDPLALPEHSDSLNWRSSTSPGGNPGTTDGTIFPGGDSAALLDYATGGVPAAIQVDPDRNISFTILVNRLAEDLIGRLESSGDMTTWQSDDTGFTRSSVQPASNGFAWVTYTSTTAPTDPRMFLRFSVEQR